MGEARLFLEPNAQNLIKFHFSLSYKTAEIFVRLSQRASSSLSNNKVGWNNCAG